MAEGYFFFAFTLTFRFTFIFFLAGGLGLSALPSEALALRFIVIFFFPGVRAVFFEAGAALSSLTSFIRLVCSFFCRLMRPLCRTNSSAPIWPIWIS